MRITGVSAEGTSVGTEAGEINLQTLAEWNRFDLSKAGLARRLESLDLSADTKALLHSLGSQVIRVGDVVVRIGRKILDVVFGIISSYPNTTFGIIFGAIAGFLIASIPLLGALIGPIVTPILAALGLMKGFMSDLADKALEQRIVQAQSLFDPLRSQNV